MRVRKTVLNMPIEMWDKLKAYYGERDVYEIDPAEFIKNIGRPNGSSGFFDANDREWFEALRLSRK